MASSKDYLEYVLEQLSEADDVTSRAMMSEYILYFRGKVIGGIYDNRFLVKPVQAARNMMPDAPEELPYDGAKPMLMVENIEDREFLKELFEAMYDELPAPKPKRRNKETLPTRKSGSGVSFILNMSLRVFRLRQRSLRK